MVIEILNILLADINEICTIRKQKLFFYHFIFMTTPTKRIPTVSKACIGCGACVSVSDGVFRINDEGYSVAIELPDYEGR